MVHLKKVRSQCLNVVSMSIVVTFTIRIHMYNSSTNNCSFHLEFTMEQIIIGGVSWQSDYPKSF